MEKNNWLYKFLVQTNNVMAHGKPIRDNCSECILVAGRSIVPRVAAETRYQTLQILNRIFSVD